MREFENSPQILAIKEILRTFFMGIIDSVKGAFVGFFEWVQSVRLSAPPMLKLFGNTGVNSTVFGIVVLYIVLINIKAYRLFKADKQYAKNNEERIPEWRLMFNMWIGGAIGAAIAMYRLRHKTNHKAFVMSAKILVFAQLLLFSIIIGFVSFWTFF